MIRVGGASEIEVKERKDRVEDALNATRAAVQEGVVVVGGVALVRASLKLDGLTGENADQTAGIAIVRKALQSLLQQIAENAGVDGSVVAGKVLELKDGSFGFNAQTEEYGDMYKFGVIDPAKVVRTALQDAASVAGLLITTEAMIADKPEPEGPGRRRHAGRHGRHDVIRLESRQDLQRVRGEPALRSAGVSCARLLSRAQDHEQLPWRALSRCPLLRHLKSLKARYHPTRTEKTHHER